MIEERRGEHEPRCKICRYISARITIMWTQLEARFKSLVYIDTRAISLLSGTINLAWVFGVFLPLIFADKYPTGFLSRVALGAPYEWIAILVFCLAFCELWSAITNTFKGRMFCSIFSVFWWTWLTFMAFLQTPLEPLSNESAALQFAIISIFRAWTFVSINYTHPEGSHYVRVERT